jgi:integrative and conjugative element protein (TIGR02256 family)
MLTTLMTEKAATPDGPPPRVFLSAEALQTISEEIVSAPAHLETGGILLGQGDGQPDFHVIQAGGPGPNAVHEPTRFVRDLDHAVELADRAWNEEQAVWIGEWHTHPVAGPVPSETDLSSYLRHLEDPELGFERFLSLIVAPAHTGAAPEPGAVLAAWVVGSDRAVLADLVMPEPEEGADG